MRYRIEELAETARTTVRNIRAYQERGVLPPPVREGRIVWYGDLHLARLRVIGALLERGYSIGNIAELLAAWERGAELSDLLGLEEALTDPFNDEPEATLRLDELARLFGSFDPVAVARAVQLGLFYPAEGGLRVPSMRLLQAGAELHRAGVPLSALIDELQVLAADVDRIAERFVDLVATEIFDRLPAGPAALRDASKMADLVRRLRPLASMVVTKRLGQSLEKHIRRRMGERIGRLLKPKESA
ncbi:MAG: MerR family transcriptional regulator [Myxococcales bacterium]|nr:MerR family transcriptional regulator [Myxococcales bacterium]